jgi:aminoglycoside 6'-N-acetyltransferase I
MQLTIRQMSASDRPAWARMRAELWPEDSVDAHGGDIDVVLGQEHIWGFIAETDDGTPVGFAEVAVRAYANDCETRPVPFLEGIWVEPLSRRRGIGRRLIAHAEEFIASRGYRELGSDALIDNDASHAAHRGWGFFETERVVYFRKPVKSGSADGTT